MRFPGVFGRADGALADVIALGTTRRFGANLLTASRRVVARIGVPASIPADQRAVFRDPVAADGLPPGKAEVLLFPTGGAEAEHIADLLRRAHLEDGVGWTDMAVLVRSGQLSIPALRRGAGFGRRTGRGRGRRAAASTRPGGTAAADRAARRARTRPR